MDDDLEPILDQMILESYEVSEKLLLFGEHKCGTETGEESPLETIQHQESGDIGPVADPESLKKSAAVKDLPRQNLKTESKTSIFRRKDQRDQTQQAGLPSSAKSSTTTSLGKFCRWSKQRLIGQGYRRSSQQAIDQQPLLSQRPSHTQAVNEADVKDPSWVSHRTDKLMKCRSQQTSLIWERKTPSEVMCPTSYESTPSKNAGSGTANHKVQNTSTTEKDNTAFEDAADGRHTGQESRHGNQQLEGKVSKQSNQQHTERFRSRRSSQRSVEQPPTGSPKYPQVHPAKGMDTDEDTTWVSQKTGKEMKCQAQQTSLMWEHSALSDILHVYLQESGISGIYGEDSTDEEEDPRFKQATANDSQQQTLHLEAEKSRQDIHETKQPEEPKPEDRRKKSKSKIDRAQQTDSAASIKKEVADSSQQTDDFEGIKASWEEQCQEPGFRTEQTYVQRSRQGSQELVGQDTFCSSPQPELQDSPRSSQQSLRSETETAEESSAVPSDFESEHPVPDQKASCIRGGEEETWVSQKTGREVRNQRQQTDQSWLLYFALKSQKLKRGISQQTDESFLQQYRAGMLKQAVEEHQRSHSQPDMRTCPQCIDLYSEDFRFAPDVLSGFSSISTSSTTSSLETAGEEGRSRASGGDEEQPETEHPLGQESQRDSQELGGQEGPKDMGQESRRGSLPAVDDQTHPMWADEFESNTASDRSLLYAEGEDKIQQTYSLISFEDGIWLNRKTGKLLVSHSQQISEISGLTISRTALEKSSSTLVKGLVPTEMDGTGVGVNQFFQLETEADGQQISGQESHRASQQDQIITFHPNVGQTMGEGSLSMDEVEKLVCRRLSEATLLSVESPEVEDEPQQIYTVVSLEEGTWLNVLTRKLLASKSQQTEAPEEK